MKITRLEIESFMGVKAIGVDIAPDGSMVVVGGHNAQGKSSLLRAIEVLLEGMAACPEEPVRRGAKAASITAWLLKAPPKLRAEAVKAAACASLSEIEDLETIRDLVMRVRLAQLTA